MLNKFRLGADPEFIFEHKSEAKAVLVPADSLGLKTGLFIGADQNGRLVEVRPKPSRSALEVTASIMVSLRWLGALFPASLKYNWLAGGYLYKDALGGHVHFGRKKATRIREISALDAVYDLLDKLGVWPREEQKLRQEGDEQGQRYGLLGDYRPQIHGYEYRTPPSWIDSPWQCFFTLTAFKLAVLDPELVIPWHENEERLAQRIRGLFAYYQGRDDDAKLAYYVLRKYGFPFHTGTDLKERWGAHIVSDGTVAKIEVLPQFIEPRPDEVLEVYDLLAFGKKLERRIPKVSWTPTTVPAGFELVLTQTAVRGRAGFGELFRGMVKPTGAKLDFFPFDGNHDKEVMLQISPKVEKLLTRDWHARLGKVAPEAKFAKLANEGADYYDRYAIGVSKHWRKVARIQRTRKVLLSGVFPLWHINAATPEKLAAWKKRETLAPTKFLGKVLFEGKGQSTPPLAETMSARLARRVTVTEPLLFDEGIS